MVVTKDGLKSGIIKLARAFNLGSIPPETLDLWLEGLQHERVTDNEALLAIGLIVKEETMFYKHSNLLALILKRLPAVRDRIKSERLRIESRTITQPPDYEKYGFMMKFTNKIVKAPKKNGESQKDWLDRISRETEQASQEYDHKQLTK